MLQFKGRVQTFGGPKRKVDNQCFLYGGPEKRQRLFGNGVPTFESLTKNRLLLEKRFYLNNSNTKYLAIGIVPLTKILDKDADGFRIEALLGGQNAPSVPLGGIEGLASLLDAIHEIPSLSKTAVFKHGIESSENIIISTGNFADKVRIRLVIYDDEKMFLY